MVRLLWKNRNSIRTCLAVDTKKLSEPTYGERDYVSHLDNYTRLTLNNAQKSFLLVHRGVCCNEPARPTLCLFVSVRFV